MSMNKIIITIDGPSGSGKTTLGRAISKKLGITFFSSGSIYRVITKYFLDTNSLGFENFEIISYEPLEIKIDKHTYFEKDLYTKELNTKSSELAQQIEIRAIVDNILKFVESSADSGLVVEGKMGLAIGKGGAHIKSLQNKIDRNVELVEYNEDPIKLLKNIQIGRASCRERV